MGACNCLHAKNESTSEIVSEKCMNAKPIQEQKDYLKDDYEKDAPDAPISLGTNIPPDETAFNNQYLIQVQALFRRHIAQLNMSQKNPPTKTEPSIPEDAFSLITVDAKQAYILLGPFLFEECTPKNTLKSVITLVDGSIYQGELNNIGQPDGKGIMYYSDGNICEGY